MLMQLQRELVVEYGRKMSEARLSPGTSGNLSVYDPDSGLMAITPSGIGYFEIRPEDVVVTDLAAHVVDGTCKPSSEWALHTAFYRRKPEIRAVVHTHSMFCTTFTVLGEPLRAVHYAIAEAGTDTVPCAPYETFGTEALAQAAVETCGAGRAVLLGNHGMVACAESMEGAFSLACNLEFAAELQYRALSIGTPRILSDEQMGKALERFKTYGQKQPQ